jgi:hypothetical protein
MMRILETDPFTVDEKVTRIGLKLAGQNVDQGERIVIALLVKMGYGGSRADAAEAIGKSGDEGLDGVIKEDRLVLDIIYVQAKRWAATVGRRFKSSLELCTGSTRLKGFSSQRRIFREMRMITSPKSGARSCSSMDQDWLNS